MELPQIQRRRARAVRVGDVTIGGDAPVSVQSMTKTPTFDRDATVAEVRRLAEAGADLVRVAVPGREETAALADIVAASPVPIIADVHYRPERALEAIEAGAAKIRLNPGNIADAGAVREIIAAAAGAGVAIRVGVNQGSIDGRSSRAEAGPDPSKPLDERMVDALAGYLETFAEADFHNLVLSAKSHDAYTCVAANRRLARRWDYPLHLGVTHAGTPATGMERSAAAIGALLAEGIGETIRISYAGDPVEEVRAGLELLYSLRLRQRRGVELVACPTCGRVQMDLLPIIRRIRTGLAHVEAPVTVAVMGCVVNGPGEAVDADVAICAGRGRAVLYRRGQKVRTVGTDEIAQAVIQEATAIAQAEQP